MDYIIVDDFKLPIEDWTLTLFQQLEQLEVIVPRFCYHEKLSIAGNCRVCMVEIESSIKPVIACATSLGKGLKVKTNSVLIKKARENVFEFLLINHPLDCPICDQAGECDLQDLSLIYGGDRSRFKEEKRSVEDKDFGPLIKTVMTRCIHCTRCVRFMDEIAGIHNLGVMGRGNEMEISTYTLDYFDSEITGNVIDLCPVGALTSKPYAFRARPWELTSIESIDILDGLCSNIRIDIKGDMIMRILPKLNPSINDEWITDKIRFSYDGLFIERLIYPLLKNSKTNLFILQSWDSIKNIIVTQLQLNYNVFNFFLGELNDIYTTLVFKYMKDYLYKNTNLIIYNQTYKSNIDFRTNYLLETSIMDFKNIDLYFFIGLNLRYDNPVLLTQIKKYNKLIFNIGLNLNWNLNLYHYGITLKTLYTLLKGKSFISTYFNNYKNINFFMSDTTNFTQTNFRLLLNNLTGNKCKFNTIHLFPYNIGNKELGLNLTYKNLEINNTYNLTNSFNYLLNFNKNLNFHSDMFVVYQGHHGTTNAMKSNIILPSRSFVEESVPYLNIEGILQWTNTTINFLGDAKNNVNILKYFTSKINLLFILDSKIPYILYTFNGNLNINLDNLIKNKNNNNSNYYTFNNFYFLTNYYQNNIISYYSKTMYKLTNLKKINKYYWK